MDFAALPPEINSARMYSGPGSGPMRAAAAAWGGLAAELHSAATSYESVVSELTVESWLGPASTSMAAAAARYVAWMGATAGQAEQAATQANAAAAAYEAAFAATVPPPVIAANRAQLMSLVATNFLGQNTPAIAATEAHYGEMWAQDATTMYGYAAATAAASRLAPFTAPPHGSNPAGLAGQAAPVTAAGGASAATNAQTLLTSAMPGALQGLASPAQAVPGLALLTIPGATEAGAALAATDVALAGGAWQSASLDSAEILSVGDVLSANQGEILNAIGQLRPTGALALAGSAGPVAGGVPAPVSGGMGRAVSVGGLAVPSSWAAAAPEIRAVAYALPATSVGAAPAVLAGTSGTAFNEMALAGMAGGALAGTRPGRRELVWATARERVTPQRSPASPVAGIAAELREFAALRDAGILTDEEFNDLKRRILNC